MTKEEIETLKTCASEVAHLHGLYSGLNSMQSNERHDQFCEQAAEKIFALVEKAICDEFSAIEDAKQKAEELAECELEGVA